MQNFSVETLSPRPRAEETGPNSPASCLRGPVRSALVLLALGGVWRWDPALEAPLPGVGGPLGAGGTGCAVPGLKWVRHVGAAAGPAGRVLGSELICVSHRVLLSSQITAAELRHHVAETRKHHLCVIRLGGDVHELPLDSQDHREHHPIQQTDPTVS